MERERIINGIENNYRFVTEVQALIDLEEDSIRRLRLLSFTGLLYSVLQTGVYSSGELEKEICRIGTRNIVFPKYDVPNNNKILHVLTRASNYGGHTVLAANWIKWDTNHESSIVLTDMSLGSVPKLLTDAVFKTNGTCYELKGNYLEKAQQLCELSTGFQLVVLHMHMYDVVPLLAYGASGCKTPVVFCNHADFRFSFGFTISDEVVNITKYDINKNIRYRGVKRNRNRFLFFPDVGNIGAFSINKDIREKYDIPEDCKLIVSMGADCKYKSVMEWSFEEFARKIVMLVHNCVFVIIGADPKRKEWIDLNKSTEGKVRALGILSKEDATSLISVAALFVSSFPMVASGASTAQNYNVPNISLLITGRGKEYYDGNEVDCIEDLIDKSLALINGEKKWQKQLKKKYQLKSIWQKMWNDIISDIPVHNTYKIFPQRLIDLQELIDYEIMQVDASNWIGRFLWDNRFDLEFYYSIRNLIKQFDISILPDDHRNKWLGFLCDNKSISPLLKKKGFLYVSLYGMAELGQFIWQVLKREDKEMIVCGIDKNADSIVFDGPIMKPEEYVNNGELVLNMTATPNSVLLKTINRRNITMMSIDDLMMIG